MIHIRARLRLCRTTVIHILDRKKLKIHYVAGAQLTNNNFFLLFLVAFLGCFLSKVSFQWVRFRLRTMSKTYTPYRNTIDTCHREQLPYICRIFYPARISKIYTIAAVQMTQSYRFAVSSGYRWVVSLLSEKSG